VTTKPIESSDIKVIYLLPNKIDTHPKYNVRPFSSTVDASASEDKRIEELALSIETLGQLDPVILTPEHVLFAGHRRRRAIIICNERRTARGESLLPVKCIIDTAGGDMRRKGIISNLHRTETSPMDMAYLITQLRKENNWHDYKGTKAVGEYLGLDHATVTSFEYFLSAEKELQNKIHDGTISAHSARNLMKTLPTPEERQKALARAAEFQSEDLLEKQLDRYKRGKQTLAQTTSAIQDPKAVLHIKNPAVIKAIRERHTVTTTRVTSKRLCLSRAELLAAVSEFDCDAYPETHRSFARYFVNQFALGNGSLEELKVKFLAVGPDEAVQHKEPQQSMRSQPSAVREQISSAAS
jgi:ParB-like chromosome segregation protein Spo0J